MNTDADYIRHALHQLCTHIDNRRVGSVGNRAATDWVAEQLAAWGYAVTQQSFDCLDWRCDEARLLVDGAAVPVQAGPFAPGCAVSGPLAAAATVAGLESAESHPPLLLLHGDLAREPLMPKRFPFYNPPEHQHLIRLLEQKQPGVIIAATGSAPELAGALSPFPLFEDGDFDIPSLFTDEATGAWLAARVGRTALAEISAERIPSTGCNVIARRNGPAGRRRIVVTAHIDAKPGTPGALDNASGVSALLLTARLLQADNTGYPVEFVFLNGEDYYAASGQLRYLAANAGRLDDIALVINVDGIGYRHGPAAYSLYGCPDVLADPIRAQLARHPDLVEGPLWYAGDHMPFVQQGVPALAVTSSAMTAMTTTLTHTPLDVPEQVAVGIVTGVAGALHSLLAGQGAWLPPPHAATG